MVRSFLFLLALLPSSVYGQLPLSEGLFLGRLKPDGTLPPDLLTTRTAVFYDYRMQERELEVVQHYFQESGIDAVVYFESDLLAAGRDVSVALALYLNRREIANLVVIGKKDGAYKLYVFKYNRMATLVEEGQPAWVAENEKLEEVMLSIYRASSQGLERSNFLINDVAETGFINPITGRRSDFYAIDLSVDALAVPKFGEEEMDRQLEEVMKLYPYKYTLTEANLSEADLRQKGYMYVLRFVHARARLAKRLLGYEVTPSQSAIVSIVYPGDQPEVKNIAADQEVYKFYFKHIPSGNTFLGTKWDADSSWDQALINQIKGFKRELKIN